MRSITRRAFVKTAAKLVAFVPAAWTLAQVPEAAACPPSGYRICDSQRCVYLYTECREGRWVDVWKCYDSYFEVFCRYWDIDAGGPC
jgi:hypothetical protein